MIGRGKSKQGCSERLSHRLEEDRISQLPDPLICQILSHLPPQDSVKTSVLSTRWKGLWLWVPRLELDIQDFPDVRAFVTFSNKFFASDRVSCIDDLELNIDYMDSVDDETSYITYTSYITSWIDAAAKRKVQHLLVACCPKTCFTIPIPASLYVCETLVSLRLSDGIWEDAEFVSFPCLKTMSLDFVCFSNEATYEKLVSRCPVLENLRVFQCVNAPQVYRVHSRLLKRLSFARYDSFEVDSVSGVVIDAPRLCYLEIVDKESKSVIVNNLESNAMVDISLRFGLESFDEASILSRTSHIRIFLAAISKVGDLKISAPTSEVLHHYSKSESLPQFGYMSSLTVMAPNLKWLLGTFLKNCPNLKSLVLVINLLHVGSSYHEALSEEMNQISLSSLEYVNLRFPFSGLVAQMMLVRYFLENLAVLKKLTLCYQHLDSHPTKDEIYKKLIEIPRASTKCEVVIVQL